MDEGKKPKWRCTVKLGSINKWLRWTGFRLIVMWPVNTDRHPLSVGLVWWGFGADF